MPTKTTLKEGKLRKEKRNVLLKRPRKKPDKNNLFWSKIKEKQLLMRKVIKKVLWMISLPLLEAVLPFHGKYNVFLFYFFDYSLFLFVLINFLLLFFFCFFAVRDPSVEKRKKEVLLLAAVVAGVMMVKVQELMLLLF